MINSDAFRNSAMRGLNLSLVRSMDELKAKNIPGAKATGANHGRIWVTATHDANNVYTSTPLEPIDAAANLGLPLILCVEFLPKQGKDDWWGSTARKNGITKLWTSLAGRYKNNPGIIAYDLMNEPRKNPNLSCTVKEYIDFQISIITAIRQIDPNKPIVVEVLGNSMLGDSYIANIAKILNLIYSPHGYSYANITHQGVPPHIVAYHYPSSKYPSGMFSSNSYWKIPNDFAKKYNVPIWVGEFSCINWAPKNSAGQWTSTRWIEDAIKYMNSVGWSWAYHAWNEYEGWDPRISSQFYANMPYKDAAPYPKPSGSTWRAQRSDTAPTITMLKKYFV